MNIKNLVIDQIFSYVGFQIKDCISRVISMLRFLIMLLVIFISCEKPEKEPEEQEPENEYEDYAKREKFERDAYLQSLRDEGYTVIEEDGIYYVVITKGTGNSPTETDYVIIDFTGRKTDNTIIETTDSSLADEWFNYQYLDHYVFGPKKIYVGNTIEGFYIGLTKMKEGGRNILVIPSELAYWDYVTLIYDVELFKVISDPAAYDSIQLRYFLEEQGLDTTNMVNNVYYNETGFAGLDDTVTVEPNDSVYVIFDSYYLIENSLILFESNRTDDYPLKFKYSESATAPEGYLPFTDGFLAALDTMSIGTKARVIVPYEYGYEEDGYRHSFYSFIIVPAYTSLVYDIEIENIIKAKI
jgi:FKBP-type peptidyl-prolyl cis-trans isomerase